MCIDTFLPLIGGAEIHALELAKALQLLGDSVGVCTATPGLDTVDGIPIRRLPYFNVSSGRHAFKAPLDFPRMCSFLSKFDVVHSHYTYLMAASANLAAQITGKPTVTTLHGLGTLDDSVKGSIFRKLLRRLSFKHSNYIIATSNEMKEVALRFVPEEKVFLVTNGVNTNFFSPNGRKDETSRDKVIILTMRRLAPKNGVQYLVEAAPYILKEIPNAEFWFAGKAKLESHINRRIEELGLTPHFKNLGLVSHEDTKAFYDQADVVVFPSSAESTSLACLEALSMEKPVVASSLSAFKQMLGDEERGYLVNLFDRDHSVYDAPLTLPEDRLKNLGRKICQAISQTKEAKTKAEAARKHVIEYYDWKVVAQKTQEIYQLAANS